MKILIATPHPNVVGGAETYVRALIPALSARGHELALLCDYPARDRSQSIDSGGRGQRSWYGTELRAGNQQFAELAAWKPDVVYSQGLESLDIEQRLQQHFPVVLYAHAYFGACLSGRKCHAFPVVQVCTRKFGAACLLMHYPRRCGGLNPLLTWKLYQEQSQRHALLPGYRAVLVASRHMYSEFQTQGVSPENLQVLRLPLTETYAAASPERRSPAGRLLFLGRLVDTKGADVLIRAVPGAERRLGRRLQVTIAGDGSERSKLEKLAEALGISAEFPGWIQGSEKLQRMREADLLVMPSLWPEPFGLAGIEAGSLGVPAVGFAAGGITDWLIPGQTGELAPADPPTAEGLADAIVRALADPEHYHHLCEAAWKNACRFGLDSHLAQLEPILAPHGPRRAGEFPAAETAAVEKSLSPGRIT